MTTHRAYLAVEGPHDVELVAALLLPDGFERVRHRAHVDSYWDALIPRTFPHGDDLLARVPVPTFFRADERWVAVQAAGGEANLTKRVEERLTVFPSPPSAVGLILDADNRSAPHERFSKVAGKLSSFGLVVPAKAGEVSEPPTRCGIYVLPDNVSQGTLEDLLLDSAAAVYPNLLAAARGYPRALALPRVAALRDFLVKLLDLPAG
jgi:hypothetical protein